MTKKDDDDDNDLTPTDSPLAKRPASSSHHVAVKFPKKCPECLGVKTRVPHCLICNNERETLDDIKYSTWDLRKTLADFIKT